MSVDKKTPTIANRVLNFGITFLDLLQIGRENLEKFKKIREKYPNAVECECTQIKGKKCDKKENPCLWCHELKRENFSPTDLSNCDWCNFCIESSRDLISTGIEPCLIGKFFDQIKELNNYIYTTSGTNLPEDPKFQEMFLGFYISKKEGEKLIIYLKKLEEYEYLMYDKKGENCLTNKKDIKDFNAKTGTITKPYHEIPDELEDKILPLFTGETQLMYMEIADLKKERRNLYEVLFEYFVK